MKNFLRSIQAAWNDVRTVATEHQRMEGESMVAVKTDESCVDDIDDLGLDYPIHTLPMKTQAILRSFLVSHKDVVYTYFLKMLRMAVIKQLPEVVLFRLGKSNFFMYVDYNDYGNQLSELRKYFLEVERYEDVTMCDRLLKRYHIERLIGETQQV